MKLRLVSDEAPEANAEHERAGIAERAGEANPDVRAPRPDLHRPNRDAEPQDPLLALIPKVLRGDAAAERTLLMAVGPSVLAVVRRIVGANHPDLEDLCQESFLALLNALPNFRRQCSVLHYACRVTVFTALAARRGRQFRNVLTTTPCEPTELCSGADSDPAHAAEQREIRAALRELLDGLPLHQSEVLAAHVLLGHTVEEVAEMTECSVNTIRSRLRRGLEALREALESRSDLWRLLRGYP